ncbi:hypothetical protein 8G_00057 [Ralstonia phage Hyacinthe]|uniref:DUF7666 domain-containing protein n=1 Tax=Ralstonia phage Hyacinthe TaxID=2759731 RepID=A0A7G5BB16_9CAUD|nr:hypothetical protein 8G_00057 [Ralstonia phage Hyacinthe]
MSNNKEAQQSGPIVSYKGFNQDWTCRDFQYEVGGSYEHKGNVEACSGGFHACEYPLHVLRYYKASQSRFAVVEQGGTLSRHDKDSKVASSRITVKAEIDLTGLIKAAVKYTMDRCTPADGAVSDQPNTAVKAEVRNKSAVASGYSGAATASGYSGAATASGYSGAATASGNYGAATASGYYGAATASGYYGAATASGDYGAATASGNYGAATASGNYGAATASGRNGKAKGKKGCALFLVYRNADLKIIHAKAAIVGQDGIKADTWYFLNAAGEFVEA